MQRPLMLAWDFDDTIQFGDGRVCPIVTAAIRNAYQKGCLNTVWSCRYGEDERYIEGFARQWQLPIHAINTNLKPVHDRWIPYKREPNEPRKIIADVYFDDRAFGFNREAVSSFIQSLPFRVVQSLPRHPIPRH